jgi:hypothetical protein
MQLVGSVLIARVFEVTDARLSLTNTGMVAKVDGLFADTRMSANLSLDSKTKGVSNLTVNATTYSSLSFSALLYKLWPDRPDALDSFVSGATFPAMSLAYSSPSSSFSIKSTSTLARVYLFENFLIFTSPEVRFVKKPQTTFEIRATVGIPSINVTAAKALLRRVGDGLPYLKVIPLHLIPSAHAYIGRHGSENMPLTADRGGRDYCQSAGAPDHGV